MKKYLLVWEVNDRSWKVIEKGNFYLRVHAGDNLEDSLTDYSEEMAQARGIDDRYFIITYCQQI